MRRWLPMLPLIALSYAGCAVPAAHEAEPVTPPEAPAQPTRVVVRVIGKASRAPLGNVRVQISDTRSGSDPASEDVDGSSGDLQHEPLTDREGRVEFAVPPGLDLDLLAYSQSGTVGRAALAIDYLRPGEQREIVVELPQGNDGVLVGRLVDADSRAPVAGASVKLVHMDHTRGGPNPASTTSVTPAGPDGSFRIPFPEWRSPHLRIEAAGYGLRLVAATAGHEDEAHALIVELSRAATIEAGVRDPAGHGIAGTWIVVKADGRALARPRGSGREFAAPADVSFPDEQWVCATDADGRAVLDKLPAHIPLRIEVRRAGEVLVHESEPLELQAGATKPLEWTLGPGSWLHGLLLDQDDQPVANQEVWVEHERQYPRAFFEVYDDKDEIVRRATTDAQGRFVIQNLLAGRWNIGPAPTRDDDAARLENAVAPFFEMIESRGEPSRELTLHVWRGIYLRGRVVGPAGEPVGETFVNANLENRPVWMDARAAKDGSFAVGPLVPGRYEVSADSHEEFAGSEPVFAQSGDSDIVLKLKPGGALRVRVIDAQSGGVRRSSVMITQDWLGRDGIRQPMMTSTSSGGILLERGLDPGRYGVAAMTDNGLFAVRSGVDVAAGVPAVGVDLALRPGGTLRLTYQGAKSMIHVTITSEGVPVNFFEGLPRGEEKSLMAPAGALVLELRSGFLGSVRRVSVELAPGETKEVVLTDKD